jgi:Icc-related predicted phosphoesterase
VKILVITDLHGRPVDPLLEFEGINGAFVLGDITTGKDLNETKKVIDSLKASYSSIYTIPGNWETQESADWLESEEISLDGRFVEIGNFKVLGIGGSTPTPFTTTREFPEHYYENVFKGWLAIPIEGKAIILSHAPPYGACDKTFFGTHAGSKALRNFILQWQPTLVLCGHIHEGRGKTNIGETIVANPGPAPKNYAILEFDESISVDLFSR